MIDLCVEGYCHECPEFDPVLNRLAITSFTGDHATEIQVLCNYRKRCAAMMRYLEKLNRGEKKEDGNASGKNSDDDGK